MNDGHPGVVAYSRYMALERTGWLEYGFCPHSPGEDESHIYYAKTLGHIYGFLGFVKQLCEFRGIDLDAVSLGMGMRGLRGKSLECIAEIGIREFWSVTPPEKDTLLMHRPSEDGEWTLDSVTKEFADNLLNHWEFARPGHFTATPEFKGSTYQGEFFRKSFHYW